MIVTFPIAILVEIGLPIALALWSVRREYTRWRWIGIGAVIFIAAQLLHVPFLYGLTALLGPTLTLMTVPWSIIVRAIILGLLAGIFEETARWIGIRLLKNRARSWKTAFGLGIGHGGIESILLVGIPVLINFVYALSMRATPGALGPLASAQVNAFLNVSWDAPLMGAVERVTTLIMQITLTALVWAAIVERKPVLFWGAVLWHAFFDALAVALPQAGVSLWILEGILALSIPVNGWLLLYFYRRHEDDEKNSLETVNTLGDVQSNAPSE